MINPGPAAQASHPDQVFLQPYFRNFKKHLVKSSKLYFRDTGLACALLGINTSEQLLTYYQRGAIFENFIFNEVSKSF